ncbi:MAG: DUF1080 domain-containing protein [Planctomycetes bacterium]|nr:DUF1080 domain-containing protein [Planctomycetota bacterium]
MFDGLASLDGSIFQPVFPGDAATRPTSRKHARQGHSPDYYGRHHLSARCNTPHLRRVQWSLTSFGANRPKRDGAQIGSSQREYCQAFSSMREGSMSPPFGRRAFLDQTMAAGVGCLAASVVGPMAHAWPGSVKSQRSLFDGRTFAGWRPMPRLPIPRDVVLANLPPDQLKAAVFQWYEEHHRVEEIKYRGRWEVKDGTIVSGHNPIDSMHGAYLVSEETFSDFELELETRPDWPVDTGIMVRAHELGNMGFQVLVDHRPHGCIGGVYGNSIGGFIAAPFIMTGDRLSEMRVGNLRQTAPTGSAIPVKPDFGASFDDFLKCWRVNDWNHFRIRCVGQLPVITTWINGTKVCELNTAKIKAVGYDPERVAKQLGNAGHLAFEVHDVSLKNPLRRDRWEVGAVCRWRNIRITEL